MGLCKCPKRKVTNQFCYEHRVNVCEYCVVAHHPKCVVQSYLLWLQDSDYNPVCSLCNENLSTYECVRLLCYHVFHWNCIDKLLRSLPDNTAPAGYKCPICKGPILPKPNVLSPIADVLREKISSVNWATASLNLSRRIREENNEKNSDLTSSTLNGNNFQQLHQNGSSSDEIIHIEDFSRPEETAQVPRRIAHSMEGEKILFLDEDEKKYKRRYPLPVIRNWFKFIGGGLLLFRRGQYRKCKIIILVLLIFCVFCYFLSILGNIVTSDTPSLDLLNNPFVRIQEEKL